MADKQTALLFSLVRSVWIASLRDGASRDWKRIDRAVFIEHGDAGRRLGAFAEQVAFGFRLSHAMRCVTKVAVATALTPRFKILSIRVLGCGKTF